MWHLGIWRAISSMLSRGSLSGRSRSREGAVIVSEPMFCLLLLFRSLLSSVRRRLRSRKKNIDIVRRDALSDNDRQVSFSPF
ncbi:unnamed protein product, partial [Iphiclides podalirius]